MKRSGQAARIGAVAALAASATVAAGLTGPVAVASGSSCTPYTLPGLGGNEAEVIAISAAGIYGGDAEDAGGVGHAVYWTHAGTDLSTGWSLHQIPGNPLVDDFIGDINTHGQMVGTGSDPATGAGVGYVFDLNSGALTLLPGLGGGNDYDRRINDAGVVAGTSGDTKGVPHAVTWAPPYSKANIEPDAGGSRSFSSPDSHTKTGYAATGINSRGQVVGVSFNGGHLADTEFFARNHVWHDAVSPLLQPLEWQANGAPRRLPTGSGQGAAWAINDSGLVVGSVADAQTFNSRPTAWVNGTNVDMGAPSDIVFGDAYGLSQGGWAAGGFIESDGNTSRAFTWNTADGFRTLDPPASETNSWSHGASDVLRQVGGSADDGSTGTAVVWQC
jgi:hypothetical protein